MFGNVKVQRPSLRSAVSMYSGQRAERKKYDAENDVQANGRNPTGPAALEILPRQKPWRQEQPLDRLEDPAVHVQRLVDQLVGEMMQRDRERERLLAARRAVRSHQSDAAVIAKFAGGGVGANKEGRDLHFFQFARARSRTTS